MAAKNESSGYQCLSVQVIYVCDNVCPIYTAPVSGCAINNGGCQIFCFSVPDVDRNGTRVQCGCPTGIGINSDNRSCNQCKYLILSDSVPLL